jgi:uroporphyrinogen decarboxylase
MDIGSSNIARLLAALRHEKLDRVPNFEVLIDARTCTHILGPRGKPRLWHMPPEDAVELVQAVGQDAIPCKLAYMLGDASVSSHDDLDAAEAPDPSCHVERLQRYADAVAGTDVGVCVCLSGPFTLSYMTAGPISIQSFMYMLYDAPDLVERMMDHYTDYFVGLIETIAEMPFDFFYIGDDIGGTSGSMFSPEHMARFWAPRMEKYIQAAHAVERPVMFHCCGDESTVLPYLAQWGVEAIHPLQPVANDIYAVHEQYGDKLTLVGNINVAGVLSYGTPEEVRQDTGEHIERLAGDGGYVVCSSHSIIDCVPPENYLAMVEATHEFGVFDA